MNLEEKLGELEVLLFIHGEPISLKKISELLELSAGETENLAAEYKKKLSENDRGLDLLTDGKKMQLITKSKFAKIVDGFIKAELSEDLTPASLETLSIISYFGPVSRNKIEYFRGVNSSFTLRNLLLRGLIERFLDPEHPNSYLYQASFELLKYLGLTKKEDLPDFEKFGALFKNAENPSNEGNTI